VRPNPTVDQLDQRLDPQMVVRHTAASGPMIELRPSFHLGEFSHLPMRDHYRLCRNACIRSSMTPPALEVALSCHGGQLLPVLA
jgi:hypothetical protein